MPTYGYICPDGHSTERVTPMAKAPGPRRIRCRADIPEGYMSLAHPCPLWARRIEVNRVGVIFHAPGFTRRVAP